MSIQVCARHRLLTHVAGNGREQLMVKQSTIRIVLIGVLVLTAFGVSYTAQVYAQGARKSRGGKVCADPTVTCKTTAVFDPNDLPFQVPANANIWESQEFYAIILKTIKSPNDDCDTFISEKDRLMAQGMFPKTKVFSSRCNLGGSIFYTNVASMVQFMAVYAGATKAQADQMLAAVKATGKFPGANIRKMRAAFNGT